MKISVRGDSHPNHASLHIWGKRFEKAEIHSDYRAELALELIKRYGNPKPVWHWGLTLEADIPNRLRIL